ncbi:MAG: diacylglycerol kinase family lipid kinase [Firmicutes bacterium]|nr:diacylglycerol kinase family lipid kinase [Bacillota bacterium]
MLFAKIIINPKAGRGRSLRVLNMTQRLLAQAGWRYEIELTRAPGHATEIARAIAAKQSPLVAVIGGDGTINEVIQGITGTDTSLAIIPGGTGNDHARSLGIPLTPAKAVALLWEGKTINMDIGKERDRHFGCLVSIGFPVDVIDHTNKKRRFFGGSLAILSSVWQTLQDLRFHEVALTLDEHRFTVLTCGIFVLNTPSVGGGLRFSPNADMTDGLLDVVVIGKVSPMELLYNLPKVYLGKHLNHPAFRLYRCRNVRIETAQPLPKMFDGEVIGYTPVEAFLQPGALQVVVPTGFPAAERIQLPDPALRDEIPLAAVSLPGR